MVPLTTAELAAHVDRLSFMPGWSIQVRDGRREGQHVVIRASVPDAYHPDEVTVLDVHSKLPPQFTAAQFDEWILWRLERIASHEVREWLRRDGAPIFDPHAPDANRDDR